MSILHKRQKIRERWDTKGKRKPVPMERARASKRASRPAEFERASVRAERLEEEGAKKPAAKKPAASSEG